MTSETLEVNLTRWWCHICQSYISVTPIENDAYKCSICSSEFVENLDQDFSQIPEELPHEVISEQSFNRLYQSNSTRLNRALGRSQPPATTTPSPPRNPALELPVVPEDEGTLRARRRNAVSIARHEVNGNVHDALANGIMQILRGVIGGLRPETAEAYGISQSSPITVVLHDDTGTHRSGAFGDYFIGGEYNRLLHQLLMAHSGNEGAAPASEEIINKLPRIIITKEQVEAKVECAVCKDELEEGFEAIRLPCEHIYCPNCITEWLKRHNTCPTCRKPAGEESIQQNKVEERPVPTNSVGLTGALGALSRSSEENTRGSSLDGPSTHGGDLDFEDIFDDIDG